MEKEDIFRKSNLERISSPEQLNDYIKIIHPSVVIIIAALVILLLGGVVWGFMGNIPATSSARGAFYSTDGNDDLDQMACVLPVAEASKLSVGMEVQVSPDTASRDTYGYIKGEIQSISQYPVGLETMTEILGNKDLAQSIMPGENGTQVVLKLAKDAASTSGLLWSSDEGIKVKLQKGITGSALIVIKDQKPIDLVLKSEGVE